MSLTLSLSALMDMLRRNSGEPWIHLVSVRHATLAEPFRFADYTQPVTASGAVYQAAPGVDVVLSSQAAEGAAGPRLVIPAVTQELLAVVEAFAGQAEADLSVVLLSSPDNPVISAGGLRIVGYTTDFRMIEFVLQGPQFLTDTVPWDLMTPARMPGVTL